MGVDCTATAPQTRDTRGCCFWHEYADADTRRHSPPDAGRRPRLANVSRETVYREVERGALPALYVGRQLRIDPDDLRDYLGRPR